MTERIGFVGLGAMGTPISRRLLDAGYPLAVYARRPEAARPLVEFGAEAHPSPTDVAQAPDPGWHYVIVSLKRGAPESRSYRIVDGRISEEPISVA